MPLLAATGKGSGGDLCSGTLPDVRAYVGVTDGQWYRFLAARPELDEVNFWRPSGGRGFHVPTVGEPFFFKTHCPHDRVVGDGFYSGFAQLMLSEAWELFGAANGADSLRQMRLRVGQYRRTSIAPGEDPLIGCLFVRNTTFFPEDAAADAPPDFAANIVQGKGYDLVQPQVAPYCTPSSTMANSSTPRPGNPLPYPHDEWTGPTQSSWSGTWTRSSKPPDATPAVLA
jgi:hypothetical protein